MRGHHVTWYLFYASALYWIAITSSNEAECEEFQDNHVPENIENLFSCELSPGICPEHSVCVNVPNSYYCACDIGFKWDTATAACVDIDECELAVTVCDRDIRATCHNEMGSYSCGCKERYSEITGKQICALVSTCTKECPAHMICYQLRLAFLSQDICLCQSGYMSSDRWICTDIDECESDPPFCDERATCVNDEQGATCTCNPGSEGDGKVCRDIDECASGSAVCDSKAMCENTDGAYECVCNYGYVGDGKTCTRICPANECDLLREEPRWPPKVAGACAASCPPHSYCSVTETGDICVCHVGFEKNADGSECIDIDECARKLHDCDHSVRSTCTNSEGSYSCSCKPHSPGTDPRLCNMKATCDNNCGQYQYCYQMKIVTRFGTFARKRCICQSGYKTSDRDCIVSNRCLEDDWCDSKASCENLNPISQCTCNAGYAGNGKYCVDKDECAFRTHECDVNAKCTNTDGSYTCECNYGYTGDGKTCDLICPAVDECMEDTHFCDVNAVCTNTPVSYSCACKDGYEGSGFHCTPSFEMTLFSE